MKTLEQMKKGRGINEAYLDLMKGKITNKEFEELTGLEPTKNNPSRKAWEERNIKLFILQAIIKEYKSMVEEIENDWGMVAPAGTDWAIGYQDALKERITSLNKKIINLESKLK